MHPGGSSCSTSNFYSSSNRDTTPNLNGATFYSNSGCDINSSSIVTVTESLGHISGQISNMQHCLMSLTSTVDGLSTKTMELTNRVAALEDITIESQQPAPKKRRIDIPRDLSVSTCYICGL